MRTITRRCVPVLMLAWLALTPAGAGAASSTKQLKASKEAGAAFIRAQQQSNGSFTGFGGEWALTGLASAGVAAANVKTSEAATDARTYYRNLIGDTATWPGGSEPVADFETATLAAYAAGIDPARVSATQNLIAQIAARYQNANPGYYGEPGFFNDTVFGLIALAGAKTRMGLQRVPQVLLNQSIEVIRRNQHTDGGWSFARAEGNSEALAEPAEAEFTGAAMTALCSAGVSKTDSAVLAAKNLLVSDLAAEPLGSGGFETEFGVNTDTNAWAVQGLNACGFNPQGAEFTTAKNHTPVEFIIAHQIAGGGFEYSEGEGEGNLYSTQDAVRAISGHAFVVPPAAAKGAPKWVYETQFSTSPTVKGLLTVVINNGSSKLGVCAVSIAPGATKTTLAAVLTAAQSAATPSGCVSGFTPSSGTGAITSINSLPSPPAANWEVSLDGAAEKQAKRSTPILIGDTIYLRLG